MSESERKDNPNHLSEDILTAIKKGAVEMRPKWHFILKIALLITGTVLAILTLLFIASFIFFSLRQNGSWFVSDFGLKGWEAFIFSLPWILLIVAAIFIIIVGLLVKNYSFAFGRPLIYSALGIIGFTGLLGFLISLTPFHSSLLIEAENEHLSFAGPIYRQYGHRNLGNIVTGRIIGINGNSFGLYSQNEEILTIIITPLTVVPRSGINVSEVVVVLGEREGNVVEALGIKPLTGYSGMRSPTMPPRR